MPGFVMPEHRSIALLAALVCCAPALGACSGNPPAPTPVADAFGEALASGDLSRVPLAGADAATATQQLKDAAGGLAGVKRTVTVGKVTTTKDRATVPLTVAWQLPGVDKPWTYSTSAHLTLANKAWKAAWDVAALQPDLTGDNHLTLHRVQPPRGDILGASGAALVKARPVERIGIDKTKASAAQVQRSAQALAQIVGIAPGPFAARVAEAGPKAFVEAITLREQDARTLAARIDSVSGAVRLPGTRPLAVSRTFAAPILGSVGEATAELVKASDGAIQAGDIVGLSGLQKRYDAQLRGQPAVTVEIQPDAGTNGHSTSPSAAPATPGASASAQAAGTSDSKVLFRAPSKPATPLQTTLDLSAQGRADGILEQVKPASAIVAIRPSTGAILAAASGPGGAGNSTATVGQYAPGSTFKIASALAMLRKGATTATPLSCTPSITVAGKQFTNYSDYPPSALGRIPLREAVAQSCNTAMMSRHAEISQGELADAAAALGLGTDADVGFPAFFGSVPRSAAEPEHAASFIGQGKVLASPLAMATLAASVAAGHTVTPHLIASVAPKRTPAHAVTPSEAAELRSLMRAVVTDGSGRFLRDVPGAPIGAKTGTAEYGTDIPPRTHAWMIATQGDLAVAVFVADGKSGSGTAGPLLESFLRGF